MPIFFSACKIGEALPVAVEQDGFRDLELEPLRQQAAIRESRFHDPGQVALLELRRRQVDRELYLSGPSGGVRTSLPQYLFAEGNDQAALLRQRDELARQDQTARGVAPAHQRFHHGELVALDLQHGLVVELEFVAGNGLAQVIFQLAPLTDAGFDRAVEQMESIASSGLRLVKREVGVAHQSIGVVAVVRRHGDADAGADENLAAFDVIRLENGFEDLVRQCAGLACRTADKRMQHGKFVTAQPRRAVRRSHDALQAAADCLQQGVAHGMAE